MPTVVGCDELIVFTTCIGGFDRRARGGFVVCSLAPPPRKHVVRFFHAIPALVTIHREEAAGHTRDRAARVVFYRDTSSMRFDVAERAARGRISAVEKRVDRKWYTPAVDGRVDQRFEMIERAVNFAVGAEAEEMQPCRHSART